MKIRIASPTTFRDRGGRPNKWGRQKAVPLKIEYEPTEKQALFHSCPAEFTLFGGAAGGGKIVPKDGVVVTPFGYKKGSEIRVGDLINSADGSIAKVIQVHPDVILNGWTVHFHDGTKTTVAAEHLWLAWRSGHSRKISNTRTNGENSAQVVETQDLLQWLKQAEQQKASGARPQWPCIPICEEQPFNLQLRCGLRIEPYLLGMLIGDGCFGKDSLSITSNDHEHTAAALKNYSYSAAAKSGTTAKAYNFTGKSRKKLLAALRMLGLEGKKSWEKFIPREYLWCDIKSRYKLIRGLMDTDGYCAPDGAYYTTVSFQLAQDVRHIIESLGGTATITSRIPKFTLHGESKDGRLAYTLYIKHRTPEKLFSLKRKKERAAKWRPPMYRRIVKIEVGEKIVGNCITISHPSGLYMTNNFIVTHNSKALRMEGLIQMMENPGSHGIILRRSFPELESSMILPSMREFPQSICRYNSLRHSWIIQTSGIESVLDYGYAKNLEEVIDRYRSSEFDFMGFDELTHFDESVIRELISRVRSSIPGRKCRIVACSNPGSRGHHWVQEYFGIGKITPMRVWTPEPSEKDEMPMSRCFIPAGINDNPHLIKNDPAYMKRLSGLPESQRKMLRDGDWTITEGLYFTELTEAHFIDPIPEEQRRDWKYYRSVDYGFSAPFCCLWIAAAPDGHFYVTREIYKSGLRATLQAEAIKIASREPVEYSLCDPSMRSKNSSGTSPMEDYLNSGVPLIPADNERILGWMSLRNYFSLHPDGTPVMRIFNSCPNLKSELQNAIKDLKNHDDIDTTIPDHALDALRYWSRSRPQLPIATAADPYAHLNPESRREWENINKARQLAQNKPPLSDVNGDLEQGDDYPFNETIGFDDL
ncbi:MAG: terminase family protein [Patescibacteria group bacterium]|nr:terminase family protein [Patescibacteria group bacterium]